MSEATFRVTKELHRLLKQTAKHTGLDVSDIIRRTARGVQRGRAVVQFDITELYYKHPGEVIRVRGFAMPEGVQPETFRRLLAMRCMEELNKRDTRPDLPGPKEGKYIIIEETEE